MTDITIQHIMSFWRKKYPQHGASRWPLLDQPVKVPANYGGGQQGKLLSVFGAWSRVAVETESGNDVFSRWIPTKEVEPLPGYRYKIFDMLGI